MSVSHLEGYPHTVGPVNDAEILAFWTDARLRGGLNPATGYLGSTVADTLPPPAWSFGDSPEQADRLLEVVLEGRKTATASAYWEYEEQERRRVEAEQADAAEGDLLTRTEVDVALPEPGLLSIVLDGSQTPKALIRTTHVDVVRFGDVDEEHARREGEDSLADWRAEHRSFFERIAPAGQVIDDDMLVVLERFVVLVPASARRRARRAGLL